LNDTDSRTPKDEDRQNANSKRRRDEDRSRGGPQHIKFEEKEEKGKMQLNGVDMVSVNAPAPAPVHSSLPAKPTHSVVPPAQAAVTRLPGSGSGASEVVTTKRGISVIGGSAQSILDSRRANRMASINANLSAAEALKRELEGASTEAAPSAEAAAPVADSKMEGDDEDADGEPDEYVEVESSAVADPDTPRGKKRKAVEQTPVPGAAPVAPVDDDAEEDAEDDEDAEGEDDDDTEAPPNPEADQPLPKKAKLQVNPDGTVEYDDTVQ
jgi:5'-3' exoribonuclease 2